jgi:predicted aspartyl protease
VKHFHGALAGNVHECLLKPSIGKVSLVRVSHRKKIDIHTQVLIDTGFSGDIVVPTTGEMKQYPPDAFATWTMADGSEVLAPMFLGTIRFPELDEDEAEIVGVTVTALGDQALIGQSILKHFTLTLDHGKYVTLEP